MTTTETSTAEREIVMTREYDAPRELVWKAWTEREHLAKWWGPHGFTTTIHEIDVRPGGMWRFMMHGPDGTDYPNRVVYREVSPPGRLTYDHGDDIDDDPSAFDVTVTFDDLGGGRTRVTNHLVFRTAEQRNGAIQFGAVELGNQTLERLARHLAEM